MDSLAFRRKNMMPVGYVDGFSNAGAVGEYVVNVRFTGG